MRVFLGRYGNDDVLRNDDPALVDLAVAEVQQRIGVVGQPVLSRVDRWERGMPQYLLGHPERIARIVVPIAAIGAGISLYHWLLERFPDNLDSGVCSKDVPCEFIWFEVFGFVTLPFMALTGFLAIIVFNTLPTPTE